MDTFKVSCEFLQKSLDATFRNIDASSIQKSIRLVLDAKTIFLLGKGRSGLVMGMFAMRLAHLGLRAHSIGGTTTPKVSPGDTVVLASGSGETPGILLAAQQAKEAGAAVLAFSMQPLSSLAGIADQVVILPVNPASFNSSASNKVLSGTLFEQALLITCDSIIAQIVDDLQQTYQDLSARHANIE